MHRTSVRVRWIGLECIHVDLTNTYSTPGPMPCSIVRFFRRSTQIYKIETGIYMLQDGVNTALAKPAKVLSLIK